MSLDDRQIAQIVKEKLADRRSEAMIQWLRKSWWRPLVPAGVSGVLGIALLVLSLSQPEGGGSALYGGVVFIGIAYMCFWAYRQNRVCHAIAHRLERIEQKLGLPVDEERGNPTEGNADGGQESASGDPTGE